MIKFFRRIRQNLLSKGKTGKYFKYAIGEIILVVIGILIALQINNWNTIKNNRDFELKMLKEINGALNKDYTFFNEHLIHFRNKTVVDAIEFFDRAIISKSVVEDSLDYHFNRLDFGLQVTYNSGAYDALKTSGIDKITNDSLRNKLINFYDFSLPRSSRLIDFFIEYNRSKMRPLIQELSVSAPIIISNDKIIRNDLSMKEIDLAANSDFNQLLYFADDKSQKVKNLLESILPEILELNELIAKEIEK